MVVIAGLVTASRKARRARRLTELMQLAKITTLDRRR
jgi:hypothetical protein